MTVYVIHVTDLFICPCKQAQTIHLCSGPLVIVLTMDRHIVIM